MSADSSSFLGKPLDETGRVAYFALGFMQRLTLFGRKDAPKIGDVVEDQGIPALEETRTFSRGSCPPCAVCGIRRMDGAAGVRAVEVRHRTQDLPCRRIFDGQTTAGTGFCPLASDEGQ